MLNPDSGWIRALLAGAITESNGQKFVLEKWFPLSHRFMWLSYTVRTDASPFGMGAILFKAGTPVSWIALDWSQQDLTLLKATLGDPAWQAEWELLALLIAFDTWLPLLRGEVACLAQTDATAALFSANRAAGRTPAMNAIAAELSLRMEAAQVSLEAEHYRGSLNFECDALSRLSQGAQMPTSLLRVPRSTPKPRTAFFFWAWPRDLFLQSGKS